MKVYAIGDLHLAGGTGKTMDRFGEHWRAHDRKIFEAWERTIRDEDLVLVVGDTSWAMRFEDAMPDLERIGHMPGLKLLVKGNHDYWWQSKSKMTRLLHPSIKILQASGVRDIVGVDEFGVIHRTRTQGMDFMKRWVAGSTNPRRIKGRLADAVKGADVFIGLSVPGILSVRDLEHMARDPIVFAMANPNPEIQPEDAGTHARVMATGRSDYPNQINNVLCFPGFFRGLLDSRARTVNDEMKVAAARAIATCVSRSELSEEYIIPSVFNKNVAPAVAEGVARTAHATGVARRRRRRRDLGSLS